MFVKDMIFMISFKGLAPSELNSLPNRVPVLKALPAKDTSSAGIACFGEPVSPAVRKAEDIIGSGFVVFCKRDQHCRRNIPLPQFIVAVYLL